MKYGYLLYQKPLIPEMPNRPVNLGDPIQSYAVKLLYREMGIAEEDIIPVPRYDMTNYDGEECICTINTCSTYEELAYDSHFMPPGRKIHAVPFSLHINRDIAADELEYYRSCTDVGCRDEFTARKLAALGVNAYLTGCLSLTFSRRTQAQDHNADKVYLIDVQSGFEDFIPKEILENAVELSNIHRFAIVHGSRRMTEQEAFDFHKLGEDRIALLRDTAKLVITSRLHAAAPCLAMGIPVIMTKHDDRFGFIDRFLTSYTNWDTDCIDWNPQPIDIEWEKNVIKQAFFQRIRSEAANQELRKMWASKEIKSNIHYEPQTRTALESVAFPHRDFKYAVLGVISSVSYFVPDIIRRLYPEAELVCGIDSYVKQDFFGVKTIKPDMIPELDKEVIIITAIPGAYQAALPYLQGRPYIRLKGKYVECIYWKTEEYH